MRLLIRAVMGAALLAASFTPAFGWSMGGHRVTAVIAARDLAATSPRVVEAVAAIMQAHPAAADFAERMREAGDGRAAQLERLFAEIAQWPDEVRSGPFKDFHRGSWHTFEIPYAAPGFKPDIEIKIAPENLLWALRENVRIAADPSANQAERAVALCWVFHLLGDLHQPLHSISLFSEVFPAGDRFGTLFWVRPPVGNETVSLHYYWDSAVQRAQNMLEVERTSVRLQSTLPRTALDEIGTRPYRGAATFERWIREESHPLAITDGYRDGQLAGAADKKDAKHLSEDYAANTRNVAARRMALSGYRLADVLRAILP